MHAAIATTLPGADRVTKSAGRNNFIFSSIRKCRAPSTREMSLDLDMKPMDCPNSLDGIVNLGHLWVF